MNDEYQQKQIENNYSGNQDELVKLISEIQDLPIEVVQNFLTAEGSLRETEYLKRFIDGNRLS